MEKVFLPVIAEKFENVKKEVKKAMGGQILEYEAKNILRQGIKQGLEQGLEQGLIKSVQKMLSKGYSCEEVSDTLEMDIEEVRAIQEELRQMA